MKNTLITARRKRIEIYTFLICFLLANVANVYAIITYETPWTELYSSMGYVMLMACLLYVVWSLLRLLVYGVWRLIRKK